MAEQNLFKWQKQNLFLDALTQMGSIEAACKQANIGRTTYYRWLKDEEFQKKMDEKKHFIYNQSIDNMVKLFECSLGAFSDLLFSQNESVRLRTATTVIKNANSIINTKMNADQYQEWTEIQHDIVLKALPHPENQENTQLLRKEYPA